MRRSNVTAPKKTRLWKNKWDLLFICNWHIDQMIIGLCYLTLNGRAYAFIGLLHRTSLLLAWTPSNGATLIKYIKKQTILIITNGFSYNNSNIYDFYERYGVRSQTHFFPPNQNALNLMIISKLYYNHRCRPVCFDAHNH